MQGRPHRVRASVDPGVATGLDVCFDGHKLRFGLVMGERRKHAPCPGVSTVQVDPGAAAGADVGFGGHGRVSGLVMSGGDRQAIPRRR